MILFIILWVLSPIFLIPMAIGFGIGNSKTKKFLNSLLNSGRISSYEYHNLKEENTQPVQNIPEAENIAAEETVISSADLFSMPEQLPHVQEPVITAKVSGTEQPFAQESTASEPVDAGTEKKSEIEMFDVPEVQTAPVKKHHANSVSVLFGIGVAFIILAGFIFSTAVWFYLGDLARTGIIALASALFFGISALSGKRLKLTSTSSAFYMLGTVFSAITVITAGYFRIFGSWFSISGKGSLLFYAAVLAVLAVFSSLGAKFYNYKFYRYSSLLSSLAAYTLILGQLCSGGTTQKYSIFALLCSISAAAFYGIFYYAGNKKGAEISAPLLHTLYIARILYGFISLPVLFFELTDWNVSCFIICALCIAELTFYGIAKKNKIMLSVQSIFLIFMIFELSVLMSDFINVYAAALIFTVVLIGLSLIYSHVKALYTVCAELAFGAAAFSGSMMLVFDSAPVHYGVLSILACEILLLATAFERNDSFSKLSRASLPVPLLIMTGYIAEYICDHTEIYCLSHAYSICSAVFTALAFALTMTAKKDKRFIPVMYSFEVFAGIALLVTAVNTDKSLILTAAALVSIAAFAEIQTSNKNIHSLMPVASFFIAANGIIGSMEKAGTVYIYASIGLCLLSAALSRLMFSRKFYIVRDLKSHWDTVSAGIILSTFLCGNGGSEVFRSDVRTFIILSEIVLFCINLYRKGHSEKTNCAILTAASIMAFISAVITNSGYSELKSMFVCAVISLCILEAIIIAAAFRYDFGINRFFRIILPAPVIMIILDAVNYSGSSNTEVLPVSFVICGAAFAAAAMGLKFVHSRRFTILRYSLEIFSGASLFIAAVNCSSITLFIFTVLLSIALFAEIQTQLSNIHSLIPIVSALTAVSGLVHTASSDYETGGTILVIISVLICAAMIFGSRLIFREALHITENDKSRWDVYAAGSFMSIFLAFTSSDFSFRGVLFVILAELAAAVINLHRRSNSRTFNLSAVTFSAALLTVALIVRPFMIIENDVLSSKVIFLIIAGFGWTAGKIWRENKQFAANFSSGIYMTVYALLLFDALINQSLFNTLIVLSTSVVILIYSFMVKQKRWFIISAAGLVGLTLYIAKDFAAELDWWVYLLLVGILLISIASANEYFKSKGASVKDRAERFFEEWKW